MMKWCFCRDKRQWLLWTNRAGLDQN